MGFKRGELVEWQQRYAEDSMIKDVGIGVVVERCESRYAVGPHAMYRVYRTKHKDIMLFEEIEIKRLSK